MRELDSASVDFQSPLGDSETQTGASLVARAGAVDAIEAVEDSFAVFC
jgi:hypothetical protein